MSSITPGYTGPTSIHRADPARPNENRETAEAVQVGSLSGREVRMISAVDRGVLAAAAFEAMSAAMARLLHDGADADRAAGPALSQRRVSTTEGLDGERRAEALSIRLSASAQAGGALFNAVMREAGVDPMLLTDRQRTSMDALVGALRIAPLVPDQAEAITRTALRAAAEHVVRNGPEHSGSAAVARAVAEMAVGKAASGTTPLDAALWLAGAAHALGAVGGSDGVTSTLGKALSQERQTHGAAPVTEMRKELTKMVEDMRISHEIARYAQELL